jgi:hypothetical protein
MAALGAVGAVFVLKYGSEASPLAGPGSVVFVAGYVGAVASAVGVAVRLPEARARRLGVGLGAGLVVATAALALVAPEANDVARLPALDVWLERLFDGAYPYGLPVRPSGFPVLFAVAFPFWAVGLLALLPVLGLAVFLATLRPMPPASRLPVLVGLALLPSFHYEVVVHSELFLNSALALASLPVFEWARRRGHGALVLAAVVAGLVLSTRLYVGAAYAVYGAYAFRSDWGRGALFASVAFAVWAATWLPLWAWDAERFAAFGPFAVQGLYLPRWAIGAGVLAALGLGWRAPDLRAVAARSGWLLLGLVAFAAFASVDRSFPLAAFVGFDVAYLAVPTPFLLFALAGRRRRDEATREPERELSSLTPAAPTPDPA